MTNRIFFPTSGAARTALALRMNAIVQKTTNLLLSETDISTICDIVADIARANDITTNFMGFGSIKSSDIEWICDAHDRMDLWTAEDFVAQERSFVRLMLEHVIGKMYIWYDRTEGEWSVNETEFDDVPEYNGSLSGACDFVGDCNTRGTN